MCLLFYNSILLKGESETNLVGNDGKLVRLLNILLVPFDGSKRIVVLRVSHCLIRPLGLHHGGFPIYACPNGHV